MQFITGYPVEKSLSVDNIFVFLMLFSYFAVPPQYQLARPHHRQSSVLRAAHAAHPGGGMAAGHVPLAAVCVRCLPGHGREDVVCSGQGSPTSPPTGCLLLKKRIRITNHFDGEKLSTMVDGVKHYTPAVCGAGAGLVPTDVGFGVDSILPSSRSPAIRFIVLTANIIADPGLRAL